MRRIALLLATVLLAAVLLASGIGTAAAEPQKNQIVVPATCDNGETPTFVINGMSKVGKIEGSTSNIVVKRFTATFTDPETGEPVGEPLVREQGPEKGVQGDPITCTGVVTTELQGLGLVTSTFEFEGFVTPRGNQ